ncbi:hypothetical protein [Aliivibrio sifiae]|uniref:Uncharacterized protein n=1 Tax=Aliivibrio sifiae TaxID=566293 RepID=A0ABQ6AHB3_9GAMM|nr:hypothetical protein [Aliivibrio sifiae]GLR75741.1 hypothetical protein GCM10007855_26150 [Aliivibrio sifiae]
MNKKVILGIFIILIIVALFTSGLMRATIELSLFLLLMGYVFITKRKQKE